MADREQEREILRRHEPVLVFAGGERFHPLRIEPYLGRCDLLRRPPGRRPWPRRAERLTADWDRLAGTSEVADPEARGSGRAAALDRFDARCFLRLLDPDSEGARGATDRGGGTAGFVAGLAVALVAGFGGWRLLGTSWWPLGWVLLVLAGVALLGAVWELTERRKGAERASAVLMSLVATAAVGWAAWAWWAGRGWREWAVLGAAFLVVGMIQSWGRHFFSERSAAGLNRLSAGAVLMSLPWLLVAPARGALVPLAISAAVAVALLLVLGDDLAAVWMAAFSSLRRGARKQAKQLEEEWRKGGERGVHPYYGRVWERNGRLALQYFYFYAFNDWRGQSGLNFHEADWEWVMVLAERRDGEIEPREVVLSQHHSVAPKSWREVERVAGHPVVYVAAGSHANYWDTGRRELSELLGDVWWRGLVKALVRSRGGGLRAADEGVAKALGWLRRQVQSPRERRSTADVPDGDGLVIGAALPAKAEPSRELAPWSPVVLAGDEPWLAFPGQWGVRTLLRNESGPPGPKWEREENLPRNAAGEERCRALWSDPPGWLSEASRR